MATSSVIREGYHVIPAKVVHFSFPFLVHLCIPVDTYVTRNPIPPPQPPSLREAMRMTASLGDFLGRKCDKEPGKKSLWIGLQRLDDLTAMWQFMVASFAPHLHTLSVSSNPGYG